ncbi:GntR family transcriptional regulator [Streptomyces spiramyceticus]|uniref:GntR family transcriptional regulator n=1 Tax=Streptomyces spiramyceticus TaxID=299717 RepID=UPI00237BE3C9|nr:GntR family transcriptional regulator [Streptomyces spiramyceticus]
MVVGASFPSASALAVRFGVSRPTVAKALDRLEAEGCCRKRGRGSSALCWLCLDMRSVPKREHNRTNRVGLPARGIAAG